jgi:hypothetical protein
VDLQLSNIDLGDEELHDAVRWRQHVRLQQQVLLQSDTAMAGATAA